MAILKKIGGYVPNVKDVFFIDSNIWIYLLNICSLDTIEQSKIEKYSNFINILVDKNIKIIILSMEISEIYNKYIYELGIQYKKVNKITDKSWFKKYYRPSPRFQKDKKFIVDNIKNNILPLVKLEKDDFDQLDIEKILTLKRKEYDFNDNYYMQLCEKRNYKILTHDKDFIKNYPDVNVEVYQL